MSPSLLTRPGLEKEIDHSDTRIAELESALAANQTDAADRALDQYRYNLNQTQQTLSQLNDTGALPLFSANYTGADYTPGRLERYRHHVP